MRYFQVLANKKSAIGLILSNTPRGGVCAATTSPTIRKHSPSLKDLLRLKVSFLLLDLARWQILLTKLYYPTNVIAIKFRRGILP
jgi:hypothetical protein